MMVDSQGVNHSESSEMGGCLQKENRSAINETDILKFPVAKMDGKWVKFDNSQIMLTTSSKH